MVMHATLAQDYTAVFERVVGMFDLMRDGVEIVENFVDEESLERIKEEVALWEVDSLKYGIRHADKKFKTVAELANSRTLMARAYEILGVTPSIVRVIYFDKSSDANWLVPWHQDKTIALNKRVFMPSWGEWSLKDGVHHVQPSLDLLNEMITFRIHLDDSDKKNGCLKVIPQSHKRGILSHEEIQRIIHEEPSYHCEVKATDAVVMRPYILHASSRSLQPNHRRIVHIEYSSYRLPKGLAWA
jgi:ectoine hydroxylase-related dioxygenase (phytanoyl-CoA dioxygenase family)